MAWHFPVRQRTNYCTEEKLTPSVRGEVLGADATGPAVASRYNSIKLGKFCLLPKRDVLAFRRPESTVLLLLVWDTSWEQWAILHQREEGERRALAESIMQAGEAREVEIEPVAG